MIRRNYTWAENYILNIFLSDYILNFDLIRVFIDILSSITKFHIFRNFIFPIKKSPRNNDNEDK